MLLWHTYALAAPVELSVQVEHPPPASGTPSGHGAADAILGLTITPDTASSAANTIRFIFKYPRSVDYQSEKYYARWQHKYKNCTGAGEVHPNGVPARKGHTLADRDLRRLGAVTHRRTSGSPRWGRRGPGSHIHRHP